MKNPGLRADSGEGQVAHTAACAARERECLSDLSLFRVSIAIFYMTRRSKAAPVVPFSST
jgi:hypothetical protein